MTRCVHGESHLDEISCEVLRRMIREVADFCGIHVVTYAIMPNHFHVLIQIPQKIPLSDAELVRRYRILHPKPTRFQLLRIEVIEDWLKRNTLEGMAWREQQLALMNDVSAYMKLLKQRFTQWFNANHGKFGTLWAERFKSVLVETGSNALRTMAAYIDLNAVRKGLVDDPKDYRFCGYSEALAGSHKARAGLALVCEQSSWRATLAEYRLLLFATGAAPREKGHVIDDAAFQAVMDAEGELPLATLLRHRWRYFSAGTALGSVAFVMKVRQEFAPKSKSGQSLSPHAKPAPTPWGGWATFHRVNRRAQDEQS